MPDVFDTIATDQKKSDIFDQVGSDSWIPDWLGKALGKARDIGTEALTEFSPELSARLLGQTTGSMRPEEVSPPLISPENAKEIVGQLPDWAGGSTQFAKGATDATANALSLFSAPGALAQLPLYAIPGVAETYAINVAAKQPEQIAKLRDIINQYGITSKEAGAAAAEMGIEDLTAFMAGKHGSITKASIKAAEPEPLPIRRWPQPDQQPERVAEQSGNQSIPQPPERSVDIPGVQPSISVASTQETPVSPDQTISAVPQSVAQSVAQPDVTLPKVEPSSKAFIPSTEWQEIPEGTVLPNGGEYRFDQATGKNFARWKPENLPNAQPIEPGIEAAIAEIQRRNAPEAPPESSQPYTSIVEQSRSPRSESSQEGSVPADAQPEPSATSTKNAITDLERESRGIEPAVQAAKRDFGTVWDEAEAIAKSDVAAPKRLVESIRDNPRALTDQENALLLRRQIEVQNEHSAAVDALNSAPDDPSAMARLESARNDVQTVYDAARLAGTETGRGLNARRMLANNDFTLAKMEAETRAVANAGKPLSVRQAAEVKSLHERIRLAESKLAAYEARDQFKAGLETARKTRVRGFRPQPFLEEQAAKARERIIARRGQLFADPIGVTQIAHLADEAIIGASHIARGLRNFGDWSKQMLSEFGERIKPFLKDLFAKSQSMHSEAARLAMAKNRTVEQTVKTLSKIGANDFTSNKLPPIRPDRELLSLRANLQRAKDEYAKRLEKQRLAQMPWMKRAASTFVKAERAMKLTGITTLGKLGGAGVTRLVSSLAEEAVGGILSKSPLLRRIAEAAPREGGFSPRAEVGALTKGLGRGIRNIPNILRGVRTNEEAVYGKLNLHYESGSVLDIPGRIHGAIKAPFKEAERERSTIKRQIVERKAGGDPTEAATELDIGKAAELDAKRAIFMQDNILSDWFRSGVRTLETNKKFPNAGFAMAKVANFLLPIVKVPTNVALETATHLTGALTASGKLIQVMSRGIRTIRPEEADMIMRHYKKGAIGVGLFLTGYFNSDKFGGFYQKGDKRDPKDVRWGAARIAGINIPAWLLHAPAFIVMQAGSTAYRMQHKLFKGEEKWKGAAAMAVAEGLANEIPFVNEMSRLDQILADGYEGTKARGNLLKSTVVPQGVQNVAGWLDPVQEPNYRKPKTELDYMKMGIPGLREEVPTNLNNHSSRSLGGALQDHRRKKMSAYLTGTSR